MSRKNMICVFLIVCVLALRPNRALAAGPCPPLVTEEHSPDINRDGVVDIFELIKVTSNYGQAGAAGDINGDGVVDIYDFVLVLKASPIEWATSEHLLFEGVSDEYTIDPVRLENYLASAGSPVEGKTTIVLTDRPIQNPSPSGKVVFTTFQTTEEELLRQILFQFCMECNDVKAARQAGFLTRKAAG